MLKRLFAVLAILFLLLSGLVYLLDAALASQPPQSSWLDALLPRGSAAYAAEPMAMRPARVSSRRALPARRIRAAEAMESDLAGVEPIPAHDPLHDQAIVVAPVSATDELGSPHGDEVVAADSAAAPDESSERFAPLADLGSDGPEPPIQREVSELEIEAAADNSPTAATTHESGEPTLAEQSPTRPDEFQMVESAVEDGEHHGDAAAEFGPKQMPAPLELTGEPDRDTDAELEVERGADELGGSADQQQSDSEESLPAAGAVLLRWQTPREVSIGQQMHCGLEIKNSGGAVQNVVVRATLSKHVRLDGTNPKPNRKERQLIWQLGEIEENGKRLIEFELTPETEGEVTPQADVTFTRATQTRIQVLRPDLELTLEGPAQMISGQAVMYEFKVHNPGSGRAHNVVIEATLPEPLKHPEGAKLSYSVGTLGPGESRLVQTPITGVKAGAWELSARATATGNLVVDRKLPVEVVSPRLQVAVEGPRLRYVDRQARYVVRVHNPGPAPANNVQVFDAVPAGFRFVEASSGGAYDSQTRQVAWFVGRLEPNATAEVDVQLLPIEVGEQQVSAIVKADSGVSEQAAASTRVEGVASIALDVIDADDPVEVNGETTYEIRVTNRGSRPANQVQVAAKLPSQMEALDVAGPTNGRVDAAQVIFDPLDQLDAGETEVYRIKVRCLQAGHASFRAYFRTAETAKAVVEEELTRIYQDE